ncbi:hypothetical protein [Pseudoalteromonas sp. M8]|uniref:hypothetical protein n=1 Tax=Pseudoalteromonas sp. M8 TaxID=2692624 RepID=UPI001BA6B3E5|nr:hypothetical protein [Pseudoalteromonas sp. M8]QUI68351.1 hypothetical protein GSF13_00510 [Pseudoalteromonas sp. M8]
MAVTILVRMGQISAYLTSEQTNTLTDLWEEFSKEIKKAGKNATTAIPHKFTSRVDNIRLEIANKGVGEQKF